MDFKERISVNFTNLTKTDKKIYNCLLEHPDYLINHNVQDAAQLLETSPAALVRLAKKIGYKGLPDLKIGLEESSQKKQKEPKGQSKKIMSKVLNNYRDNIALLESQLDEGQLHRIAKKLASSDLIKVLGIGSSGLSAEQLVYSLLYQDKYTESITSKTKMYYLSRTLTKEHVLLFYTVTGNKDFEELFEAAKAVGCQVIIVTMVDSPYIRQYATELVILPSNVMQLRNPSGDFYQLDNRSLFLILSEILAAYVNQNLK